MSQKTDQYHHGDLRAALLATAADMIAEHGVDNLSLRGLAQAVGVSRTAPYRHFEDKAALLAAVAADGVNRLTATLQAAIAPHAGNPVAALHAACVDYVEFAAENPAHYRLMFGQAMINPANYPSMDAAMDQMFDPITQLVIEGQQAGSLKPCTPMDFCHTVWALIHGLSFLIIDGRHHPQVPMRTLASDAFLTLFEGMRA